jgi:hypothetical protein
VAHIPLLILAPDSSARPTLRSEILHDIDLNPPNNATALRMGKYKLVVDQAGETVAGCRQHGVPCLYDIEADPVSIVEYDPVSMFV